MAALNIVSTLILMVTDKIKEIGTLSAMGARPFEIARVFMLQGSVIGVGRAPRLGLALGCRGVLWLDRYEVIKSQSGGLLPDPHPVSYRSSRST